MNVFNFLMLSDAAHGVAKNILDFNLCIKYYFLLIQFKVSFQINFINECERVRIIVKL